MKRLVFVNGKRRPAYSHEGAGGPLNFETGRGELKVQSGDIIVDVGDGVSAVMPASVALTDVTEASLQEDIAELEAKLKELFANPEPTNPIVVPEGAVAGETPAERNEREREGGLVPRPTQLPAPGHGAVGHGAIGGPGQGVAGPAKPGDVKPDVDVKPGDDKPGEGKLDPLAGKTSRR